MRDLDDLSKEEFERMANDLMLAAFPGFRPYPTKSGMTDGGYDGWLVGAFHGDEAEWRLSVKHRDRPSRGASSSADWLREHIRRDLNKYPDQSWIVVTNVDLPPAEHNGLEAAFADRARHLKILALYDLQGLFTLHPHVPARYDLLDAAWVPGQGIVRAVGEAPLPPGWEPAVDQVMAWLQGAASGRLQVEAPDGASVGLLLDALFHRLLRNGPRSPVPIELEGPADVARLREAVHKIGPGPPSAARVASRIRRGLQPDVRSRTTPARSGQRRR